MRYAFSALSRSVLPRASALFTSAPLPLVPFPSTTRFGHLPLALALVACAACSSGTAPREEEVEEEPTVWTPPADPPAGSPVAIHGQLRIEGTQIVDESGNTVQLKGVSTQWLNYEASFSTNRAAVLWMAENWNISVIRGAMGVEETGYLINRDAMLSSIERVIQNAIDAGIYVIVDWHDHHAQDHQSEAQNFFASMAQKWGEYPNIIWETFNEPVHQVDWETVLRPYHQAVVDTIRQQDEDNLIVLGNAFWSQRPNDALVNPIDDPNVMYTLHFYACEHGQMIRDNAQAALDGGLPVFVTEWGASPADGGLNGLLCVPEGQEWIDFMNQNSLSWAAWRLDACLETTCFFKPGSAYGGGWTSSDLQGHGPFVVEKLLE